MEPDSSGFKPPYMAFQTFWNFIEELSSKPLPPRIDRSLMGNKSGTDQNNLTSALVSFGLVDAGGVVLSRLQQLTATDHEGRKKLLAELVREYYPNELAVSEANATINGLHESFRDSFGLTSAETRRKCETFFLHALRVAELPVSPHFPQTRSGSGAPGTPKKRLVRKKPADPGARQIDTPPSEDRRHDDGDGGEDGGVYKQTVTLRTGGTMTLSVSVNPLTLRGDDRNFFYQIVDALAEYADGDPEDSQL